MFDLIVVHEALIKSLAQDSGMEPLEAKRKEDQDSIVSQLIHDVFGGEILKTRKRRGWHFYNRVDGLRLDFTRLGNNLRKRVRKYEDIPSSPEETRAYFAVEDYSIFFMRFVRAFEEAVGLPVHKQYS